MNETNNALIEMLKKDGVKHTVKISSTSIVVRANGKNHFFPMSEDGDKIEAKYLSFIKSVKNEVILMSEKLELKESKPKYINFLNLPKKDVLIKDAVEIDINGAYWKCAYKVGLLSEGTYLKGLECPKIVRLIAFGACATTKEVFSFDGEKYTLEKPEFSKAGRAAFFHVAAEIGEVMYNARWCCPDTALFYWVDAIFVRSFYTASIVSYMQEKGYECKIKPLLWAKTEYKGKDAYKVTVCEKGKTLENLCEIKIKNFAVPQKKNKKKSEKITRDFKNDIFVQKNY